MTRMVQCVYLKKEAEGFHLADEAKESMHIAKELEEMNAKSQEAK